MTVDVQKRAARLRAAIAQLPEPMRTRLLMRIGSALRIEDLERRTVEMDAIETAVQDAIQQRAARL